MREAEIFNLLPHTNRANIMARFKQYGISYGKIEVRKKTLDGNRVYKLSNITTKHLKDCLKLVEKKPYSQAKISVVKTLNKTIDFMERKIKGVKDDTK